MPDLRPRLPRRAGGAHQPGPSRAAGAGVGDGGRRRSRRGRRRWRRSSSPRTVPWAWACCCWRRGSRRWCAGRGGRPGAGRSGPGRALRCRGRRWRWRSWSSSRWPAACCWRGRSTPCPVLSRGVQLHVGAALLLVPLVVQHVVAHPQRLTRTDLSRRQLLRTTALGAGAAATWGGLEVLGRLADLPGADRRFTGSDLVAVDDPDAVPVVLWFTDTVPESPQLPAVVRTPVGGPGRGRAGRSKHRPGAGGPGLHRRLVRGAGVARGAAGPAPARGRPGALRRRRVGDRLRAPVLPRGRRRPAAGDLRGRPAAVTRPRRTRASRGARSSRLLVGQVGRARRAHGRAVLGAACPSRRSDPASAPPPRRPPAPAARPAIRSQEGQHGESEMRRTPAVQDAETQVLVEVLGLTAGDGQLRWSAQQAPLARRAHPDDVAREVAGLDGDPDEVPAGTVLHSTSWRYADSYVRPHLRALSRARRVREPAPGAPPGGRLRPAAPDPVARAGVRTSPPTPSATWRTSPGATRTCAPAPASGRLPGACWSSTPVGCTSTTSPRRSGGRRARCRTRRQVGPSIRPEGDRPWTLAPGPWRTWR